MQENINNNIIEEIDNKKNLAESIILTNSESNRVDEREEHEKFGLANKEELQKIKKQLSNYTINIENKYSISEKFIQKYKEINEKLDELVKKQTPYYEKNAEDKYKAFTLADKQEFLNIYNNLAKDIEDIKNHVNKVFKTEDEENILKNVDILGDFCAKDIRALIKVTKETTLPNVIYEGRKRVIDVSNQKKDKIGAVQSERQVITENGVKKVFTPTTYFDTQDKLNEIISNYCKDFPEYGEFFRNLNSMTKLDSKDLPDYDIDSYGDPCGVVRRSINKNILAYFNTGEFTEKQKEKFRKWFDDDRNFRRVAFGFFQEVDNLKTQNYFKNLMGFKPKEAIDEKNSAMSVVAELLGMNDIITHSESVKIKDGDKEVEGTVMDFAEGVDVNKIDLENPISKYSKDEVEITGKAKKQMADLQILDYICGNIDRHLGNVFYQYDTSDRKHPKLIGIKGIDNDCSFNNRTIDSAYGENRMTGLVNLSIIDEKTRDKILSVNPEMIRLALRGFKMDEVAISNAISRYVDLRQTLIACKDKEVVDPANYKMPDFNTNYEIKTVKENSWDELNIKSFNTKFNEENKLFQKNTLIGMLPEALGGQFALCSNKKEIMKLYKSNINLLKEVNKSKTNSKAQVKNVSSGIWFLRGSSAQYNKIRTDLRNLDKAYKNLTFAANPDLYKRYIEQVKNIKGQVSAYLERKKLEETTPDKKGKLKKHGTYTKNRIDIMKALEKNLDERINNLTEAVDSVEKDRIVITNRTNQYNINEDRIKNGKEVVIEDNDKLRNKLNKDLSKGSIEVESKKIETDTKSKVKKQDDLGANK